VQRTFLDTDGGSPLEDRPPGNRLLAALPKDLLRTVAADLEPVELEVKQVLFDVDVPIEHVYFPECGIVSLVGAMKDGTAVEVATIGNEGMVGLPLFLGVDRTPAQAFVQVAGHGLRMHRAAFRRFAQEEAFREVMNRFTQALFTLLAQGAACNRIHSVAERCARWLLLTHDRVEGDEFRLTQEFFAQMLGVRRASVNGVARQLEDAGMISYRRGSVRIVDRSGLEEAACECYRIIRSDFDRLLHGRDTEVGLGPRSTSTGKTTLEPPDRDD
jgi:CRP-like cAMP-binding protein